ncbi:MAG: nuclear transport factor 2 family protein [Acidobacteriaceae bacterium]
MNTTPLILCATIVAASLLLVPASAQQSRWASADDATAAYIINMERKWAEGVCANNGVVAGLLADDFQGTSTNGERFTKANELSDEKGPHSSHGCGLDATRVRFFGDNLALVYGSEHAIGKDKSQPAAKVCQVWTDTWLRRNGKWQIVASQDNRVPCT